MTTDKNIVKERFGSGFRTYDKLAVVQQQICDELADMCRAHIVSPPGSILEIGIGTGFLTRRLVEMYPEANFTLNDITDKAASFVDRYTGEVGSTYLWGDAEEVIFPVGVDLIASASTIQWFDDLPVFIAKAASATSHGGYLALTTFGTENFREISAVANEGLAYYDKGEIESIVSSAGFEIIYCNDYTRTLLFACPSDVLHHIKATGVNSISKTNWTRKRLAEFEDGYRQRFSIANGRVTLTYHPIFVVAKRL